MKIKLWLTFMILCICFNTLAYGYQVPATLRIGLESNYKNISTVSVSNKSALLGFGTRLGFVLCSSLSANEKFVISVNNEYFVQLSGVYSSFAEATSKGIVFVSDSSYYVYSGGYNSQSEAQAAAQALGGTVVAPNNRKTALKDGNKTIAIFDSSVVSLQMGGVSKESISLGNRSYRGNLEFHRDTGGTITVINVVGFEEYLYSVVPSEMPSSWPVEALKAQTVAARSYTLTRMGVHTNYDLCDTTHCQNYLGSGNEATSTTKAVNDTKGQIAYYSGQPINAVYFSSSGGATDDSENVWITMVPYLRGVDDSIETSGKVWTRTFTLQEINSLLAAKQINIGDAVGLEITSVKNNRVQELTVKGSKGNKVLTKDEISPFFGGLDSRNFTIGSGSVTADTTVSVMGSGGQAEVKLKGLYGISASSQSVGLSAVSVVGKESAASYSPTSIISGGSSSGNVITISGRGWGHGVGMSQHGAKDMAEAGFNYIDILKHYYTGINVE